MQQIKIFKSLESEVPWLEDQVNTWLAKNPGTILNVFGNIAPQSTPRESDASSLGRSSFAPSDIMLVVLYEKPS